MTNEDSTVESGASLPVRDGGSMSYQCPLLTATNYTSWAIKMEAIMDAQGVWEAIEPPAGTVVDTKLKKKARAFIFQALPEDILLQVSIHKEAKDVWDALKTRFIGADRVQQARIQMLNREFELLKMKDTDSIDDFSSKIGALVSKFRTLGSTLEQKVLVRKLLASVPKNFLPIVATIEQYSDLATMPFKEAVGRLKAYEESVKPDEPLTNRAGSLLLTQAEWQQRQINDVQQAGRGRGRSSEQGRGRAVDAALVGAEDEGTQVIIERNKRETAIRPK